MAQKLYSYQRWSSAVQAEGTTKDRQSAAAVKYAEDHDLELVEIIDAGVSAFKGVNARKGGLAAFIKAVEDGYIEPNSILYVESLDRISRNKILKALGLFNDLLELGITIVTGSDGKVYTEDSVNENSMDLLQSMLLFSRAHEESKTKQMRTNGHALAMIRRFQSGEPTTIKSIGSHPWWIDASGKSTESVKPHPQLWIPAQDAINMFLDGKSVFKVTQILNEKYPHAYKNKAWRMANVRKLRFNEAVYGVRKVNVDGRDYTLPNYFPALITEGQFLRLESIRETTKYIGKVGKGRIVTDADGNEKVIAEKNNINLLSGMEIFRCGHCRGTMMAMRHGQTIRYLCEKGRGYHHDCKTWSMPGMLVEHTLMLVTTIAYINMQRKGGIDKVDYSQQIANTEVLISQISERISRGTKLVLAGLDDVDEVIQELQDLKAKKNQLTLEIDVLQRKQLLAQDTTFEDLLMNFFNYAQYGVLQDPVHEYRSKLRDIVYSSIGEVLAWKVERRLMISFQIKGDHEYYTFSAGDEPYNYIFYYGSPVLLGEDIQEETVELSEAVKTRVRAFSAVYEATMQLLSTAHELLKTVNYPELSGKLFWPKK
ncbi:recombinase family protein [Erwinia sp. 1181_3]|uniref:recombinase family protein n=1 Tax=Erwinia sp. 1181_3 TaxID=2605957 RepID=UPI004059EA66